MLSGAALNMEAREAYEAIAPAYDVLIGEYGHDRWMIALEALASEHGVEGRRLLDIACGTGASFLPLLKRGYEVTACDISPAMIEVARAKAPDANLHVADMRELPTLGCFDLVTCVDDPLNYLLTEGELRAALRGIAQNLADGGVAVWDLNTLAQYRGQFAHDQITTHDEVFIGWRSPAPPADPRAGDVIEVQIDLFAHSRDGLWRRSTSVHRQRHWPSHAVERVAREAGLQLLEVLGQRPGAVIGGDLDELFHTKAVYLAAKAGKEDPVVGRP